MNPPIYDLMVNERWYGLNKEIERKLFIKFDKPAITSRQYYIYI